MQSWIANRPSRLNPVGTVAREVQETSNPAKGRFRDHWRDLDFLEWPAGSSAATAHAEIREQRCVLFRRPSPARVAEVPLKVGEGEAIREHRSAVMLAPLECSETVMQHRRGGCYGRDSPTRFALRFSLRNTATVSKRLKPASAERQNRPF